jgi:large conductance mechanosensitive channel
VLNEFKEFLIKGNMVDLAIGFIFGAAFATLIKSLVANVVMPPIGLLLGGVDFSELFIALDGKDYTSIAELTKAGAPAIKYGVFVNDAISFVTLGFVMFMFVKSYNKMKIAEVPKTPTTKKCDECAMDIPLDAKICPYCGTKHIIK